MSYENRQAPEGINVSKGHPLKEFFTLSVVAAVIIILFFVVLTFLAEYLVQYIPFKIESKLSEPFVQQLKKDQNQNKRQIKIQKYLQDLADKLSAQQKLPKDMVITVHYIDEDVTNAFATIGGHIGFYQGLLKQLPHENALSMVMAHEIAHVKHRDPIVSVGRGLTVMLALASLGGVSNNNLFEGFIGQASQLTTLTFNREQESEADEEAYQTLTKLYGHLIGAADLFEILKQNEDSISVPIFLSTHPLTIDRIKRANVLMQAIPSNNQMAITPLPTYIQEHQEKD